MFYSEHSHPEILIREDEDTLNALRNFFQEQGYVEGEHQRGEPTTWVESTDFTPHPIRIVQNNHWYPAPWYCYEKDCFPNHVHKDEDPNALDFVVDLCNEVFCRIYLSVFWTPTKHGKKFTKYRIETNFCKSFYRGQIDVDSDDSLTESLITDLKDALNRQSWEAWETSQETHLQRLPCEVIDSCHEIQPPEDEEYISCKRG